MWLLWSLIGAVAGGIVLAWAVLAGWGLWMYWRKLRGDFE